MNKKTLLVSVVLLVVIVGTGSFYGGMVYGKSSSKGSLGRNFNPQQFGASIAAMGQRGDRTGGAGMPSGGGFVSGEVISQDAQSVTLKLQDTGKAELSSAGTKIVFFSSSTQVMKTQQGLISDIKTGENLMVSGKANSDGSITAQSIQIRPSVPVVGK